jgi:hypothetical protein
MAEKIMLGVVATLVRAAETGFVPGTPDYAARRGKVAGNSRKSDGVVGTTR